MNVNELIAKLMEFPPEARALPAVISTEWGYEEVRDVIPVESPSGRKSIVIAD